MNERIQQLAEHAGFIDSWFSESGDDCERELKKFANLIIAECISAVASNKTVIEKVGNFCEVDSVWKTASLTQNNTDINAIEMRFGL